MSTNTESQTMAFSNEQLCNSTVTYFDTYPDYTLYVYFCMRTNNSVCTRPEEVESNLGYEAIGKADNIAIIFVSIYLDGLDLSMGLYVPFPLLLFLQGR